MIDVTKLALNSKLRLATILSSLGKPPSAIEKVIVDGEVIKVNSPTHAKVMQAAKAKVDPYSCAVLMTNINSTGEDVMVFSRLSAEILSHVYSQETKEHVKSITFDECYDVPPADVGLYIHEPCWLSDSEERRALEVYIDGKSL